ncbi:uncharacterized protein BDZ99DRAFT_458973, partial [Mytilinidion resinicola]
MREVADRPSSLCTFDVSVAFLLLAANIPMYTFVVMCYIKAPALYSLDFGGSVRLIHV